MNLFNFFKKKQKKASEAPPKPGAYNGFGPTALNFWDGETSPTGFGLTKIYIKDYWMLRTRSSQLFEDNLYARGLIRRLVTNEINKGLSVEATPIREIVGQTDEFLNTWSENVENMFSIWASTPTLCDQKRLSTFGELQRDARMEALINGDVLVVMRIDRATNLPKVQLIRGDRVQTPVASNNMLKNGNQIVHGVEIDPSGRHVAFWVLKDDGLSSDRIPAFGPKTKRKIAWLAYGTDKRINDVRGTPLLALVLESLNELRQYRNAAVRKANVNAMVAWWLKKTEDKPASFPLSGGAVRKTEVATSGSNADGSGRKVEFDQTLDGMVFQELQTGEEPVVHSTSGTDINLPAFEAGILSAMAWAHEIPPEILMLSFNNNYSASRAAINEFKIYLDKVRPFFAASFNQSFYQQWLVNMNLKGDVSTPGFLDAWRDPNQINTFLAWTNTDWSGAIKPSVDMKKEVDAYRSMLKSGLITHDRAAKELTGTKYSKNVQRLQTENQLLANAMRPLLELEQEFGSEAVNRVMGLDSDNVVIDESGEIQVVKE